MIRSSLWMHVQGMVKDQSGPVHYYPPEAVTICRKLYMDGHHLSKITELTGVPYNTICDWASHSAQGRWNYFVPAPRLQMPESTLGCVSLAAEMLWLARKPV